MKKLSIFLLSILSTFANADVKQLKTSIDSADYKISLQACKDVATLSASQAKEFLPLLESLTADKRRSLIVALGNAKVEELRDSLLSIIEENKDGLDVLCALWSLEKLKTNSDDRTLNALLHIMEQKEFRTKNYATELFKIQDEKSLAKYFKKMLSKDESSQKKALGLIKLVGTNLLLDDVVKLVENNTSLANLALSSYAYTIDESQFQTYISMLGDFKITPATATFIANSALRLNKCHSLLSQLDNINNDSTKELINSKLGLKHQLIAMDTTILDLGKNESMSLDKIKLATKLGYKGVVLGMSRIVKIKPNQQAPDGTQSNINTVNTLYTSMRQIDCRVKYVLDFTSIKDGEIVFTKPLDEVLQYAYPMGGSLMITVKGKPNDFKGVDICKILDDLAGKCQDKNVKLIIYPHQGSRFEHAQQTLDVIKNCKSKNIYTMYNIPHEYVYAIKIGEDLDPDKSAKYVLDNKDKLIAVTISGMDKKADKHISASKYVMPLGEGAFDVKRFLDGIYDGGYDGDVALQGASVWLRMPIQEALTKSINTWKKWYSY